MVVEKLPFHLQERWRKEVDMIREQRNRRVPFSDFVEFIETEFVCLFIGVLGRVDCKGHFAPITSYL